MNGQLIDVDISNSQEDCSTCEEETILIEGSLETSASVPYIHKQLQGPIHLEYWTPIWNTRLLTMFYIKITQLGDNPVPFTGQEFIPMKYYGIPTVVHIPVQNTTFKFVFADITNYVSIMHVILTLERSRSCSLPCLEDTIEFYKRSDGNKKSFVFNKWVWKSVYTKYWEWYFMSTAVYDKYIYMKLSRVIKCHLLTECNTIVTYKQNLKYATPVPNKLVKLPSTEDCRDRYKFCVSQEECFTIYNCTAMTWQAASEFCEASGEYLPVITDSTKQWTIRKALLKYGSRYNMELTGFNIVPIGLTHNQVSVKI